MGVCVFVCALFGCCIPIIVRLFRSGISINKLLYLHSILDLDQCWKSTTVEWRRIKWKVHKTIPAIVAAIYFPVVKQLFTTISCILPPYTFLAVNVSLLLDHFGLRFIRIQLSSLDVSCKLNHFFSRSIRLRSSSNLREEKEAKLIAINEIHRKLIQNAMSFIIWCINK